ncbi:RAD54 [Symbiodinium microadriaticum]|nr:RAD54 [Symbiodinium microadriaticum]
MNTLNSLRYLMLICSHPDLLVSAHRQRLAESKGDGVDEELQALVDYIQQHGSEYSSRPGNAISAARVHGGGAVSRADRALIRTAIRGAGVGGGKAAVNSGFDPELSGKFLVLYRLMCALRVHPARERIVIVSNSTQTLDLIEAMCRDNNWPTLRLDGSTNANKRTKLVAQFNDKCSNSFAFLLSSKAGGCGINLIGGSRLVMFDPDWNPASDKQAAARIWREGQQRRCYIYRFMSTCTVEEKIIQRQLSKEGLQNIVDDKEQVLTD